MVSEGGRERERKGRELTLKEATRTRLYKNILSLRNVYISKDANKLCRILINPHTIAK